MSLFFCFKYPANIYEMPHTRDNCPVRNCVTRCQLTNLVNNTKSSLEELTRAARMLKQCGTPIDIDGDGKVDFVGFDTDGDGKLDTMVPAPVQVATLGPPVDYPRGQFFEITQPGYCKVYDPAKVSQPQCDGNPTGEAVCSTTPEACLTDKVCTASNVGALGKGVWCKSSAFKPARIVEFGRGYWKEGDTVRNAQMKIHFPTGPSPYQLFDVYSSVPLTSTGEPAPLPLTNYPASLENFLLAVPHGETDTKNAWSIVLETEKPGKTLGTILLRAPGDRTRFEASSHTGPFTNYVSDSNTFPVPVPVPPPNPCTAAPAQASPVCTTPWVQPYEAGMCTPAEAFAILKIPLPVQGDASLNMYGWYNAWAARVQPSTPASWSFDAIAAPAKPTTGDVAFPHDYQDFLR